MLPRSSASLQPVLNALLGCASCVAGKWLSENSCNAQAGLWGPRQTLLPELLPEHGSCAFSSAHGHFTFTDSACFQLVLSPMKGRPVTARLTNLSLEPNIFPLMNSAQFSSMNCQLRQERDPLRMIHTDHANRSDTRIKRFAFKQIPNKVLWRHH